MKPRSTLFYRLGLWGAYILMTITVVIIGFCAADEFLNLHGDFDEEVLVLTIPALVVLGVYWKMFRDVIWLIEAENKRVGHDGS